MNTLTAARICYRCDYETTVTLGNCPDCGHRLRTPEQIRTLGWVLAITGSGLTAFMAMIAVVTAGIIWQSENAHATVRFTGGTEAVILIFGIFGLVILFGLTALTAGIWQIRHGRRNKKLTVTVLRLAVVLVVAATLTQIIL